MSKAFFGIATVAALTTAVPASAALFEKNIKLVATRFEGVAGTRVDLDFNIAFDNSADVSATTSGLSVLNFSLVGYPISYAYSRSTDTLYLATIFTPSGYRLDRNQKTIGIRIGSATSSGASVFPFAYTNGAGSLYSAFDDTEITISEIKSAVPEPSSWMMMILGFGAVGYAMRRKTVPRYV